MTSNFGDFGSPRPPSLDHPPEFTKVEEAYLPFNSERLLVGGKKTVMVQPMTNFRMLEMRLSPLTKKYFHVLDIRIGQCLNNMNSNPSYFHGSLFPMKLNLMTCGPSQSIQIDIECVRHAAYFRGMLVGIIVRSY